LSQTLSNHIDPKKWENDKNRAKAYTVGSFRRVLCFAVYRNFELCQKVHEDVCSLTKPEAISYLKSLRKLFENSSQYSMQWAINYIVTVLKWL